MTWGRAVLWFSWEGMGKAGLTGFGLANLNNVGGPCGTGTVPGDLMPGPGMVWAGAGGSVDEGGGRGWGLWIGWCAYERCACRRVVCYL